MRIISVLLVLLLTGGMALAMSHEATVAKGKALFNDVKLGSNGKSCNSCHPDGQGLEKAAADPSLAQTVNNCIRSALQGQALAEKSLELQSFLLYLKSLGKK